MTTAEAFPPVLRRYRTRAGLSQSKLAERADLDHSYVSRLECGARAPRRAVVERLADVLALRPHERDELLIAAGFAGDQELLYDFTVQRLASLLGRPEVPDAAADHLRRVIADLIALYETLLRDERTAA